MLFGLLPLWGGDLLNHGTKNACFALLVVDIYGMTACKQQPKDYFFLHIGIIIIKI
jgi:hypothetical protein